jgi:hypothetical protein
MKADGRRVGTSTTALTHTREYARVKAHRFRSLLVRFVTDNRSRAELLAALSPEQRAQIITSPEEIARARI